MDVSHSTDLLLSDLSVLLASDKSDIASSEHDFEYILYSMDISHSTDLLLSDRTVLLASDKSDNASSKHFIEYVLYSMDSVIRLIYCYQT